MWETNLDLGGTRLSPGRTYDAHVDAQGRILLPAEVRRQLDVHGGERVVLFVVNDTVHVQMVRDLAQQFRGFLNVPNRNLSEELVQERREEAARETRDSAALAT
jgi:AbrB family looped-hinge helix DNA binding protein